MTRHCCGLTRLQPLQPRSHLITLISIEFWTHYSLLSLLKSHLSCSHLVFSLFMLLAGLVGFSVDAQTGVKGHRTPQSNADPWFFLEDLWESFIESSAFGVEVPLIVNGSDSIQQYYVPYLSAIQLYSEERYAIYRIPVGSTLKSLDTSFLTFHSLSTHSRRRNQPHGASSGRKVQGVDRSLNISLPIFGFASYKYSGSVFSPDGASESKHANSIAGCC